jgi:transposase
MIYEEIKARHDRIRGYWQGDSRALPGIMLSVTNQMEHRILKLEDQIAINSHNSSKPPSLDLKRPVKRECRVNVPKRDHCGRPGQKDQGSRIKDNPDNVVSYKLVDYLDCSHDLRKLAVDELLNRQVEAILPTNKVLTEYQTMLRTCPVCITRSQAVGCAQQHEFEYRKRGIERVKALLEVFGLQRSTGTLKNFRRTASKQLDEFIARLSTNLNQASAPNFDVTGIRVNGENHWVHVASSKMCSLYGLFRGRGKSVHESIGILPIVNCIAHKDAYRPYDDYAKKQGSQCCAHIVRELEFVVERHGQQLWAQPLKKLLLKTNNKVLKSNHGFVSKTWYFQYRNKYRIPVKEGLDMNSTLPLPGTQFKWATTLTKTRNLLMRLYHREEDILRFMVETLAKFTNNRAERDLRINKVRAIVSGGFRNLKPVLEFMRIRALISTAIKQAVCQLQVLEMIFAKDKNADFLALVNSY